MATTNNQSSFMERLIRRFDADQYPEYKGKYINQIANSAQIVKSGDQYKRIMFSVDDHLCGADAGGDDKNMPLGMRRLSRYTLIINDGSVVEANLPADEVHALAERCRAIVHGRIMKAMLGISSSEQQASPVKIMMGKFKGRTAEEVLLENPNNANDLMQTMQFISQNIDNPANAKYREGNIRQVQAIQEAITKLNNGTLKPTGASVIKVYDGNWKNHAKKLPNGLYKAYHLEINCHMSGNSPWEILIESAEVPVDIDGSGKQVLRLKERSNLSSKRVFLGTTWEDIIEKMDANLRAFEISFYAEQKAYVEANSYYYRQKKNGGGNYNNQQNNYQSQTQQYVAAQTAPQYPPYTQQYQPTYYGGYAQASGQ